MEILEFVQSESGGPGLSGDFLLYGPGLKAGEKTVRTAV